MDELGFNKVAGAVLGTLLAFLGVRTIADAVVPEPSFEAVYVPEVDLGGDEGPVEADPGFNHPDFIAAMDASAGEKVWKKCQSCHNAEKGGANGTGPNMWGVMGRQMGTHQGFAYSAAMQGKAAPWTWEEMNGFLVKPKEWLPGTAMNYIGLKKWEDRAAVMAYLNTQTDNPLPLPTPVAPDVEEVVEVGDLPDSDAGPEVMIGEETEQQQARIEDEPKVEGIPGQEEGDDESFAELPEKDADADEKAVEDDDDFQSAGEVTPEDLDDSVRAAIPGEQPSEDVEVIDGPMEADDVMKFLERNNRAE